MLVVSNNVHLPDAEIELTARDRMLLLQLGRGPARVAVADVPRARAPRAEETTPVQQPG